MLDHWLSAFRCPLIKMIVYGLRVVLLPFWVSLGESFFSLSPLKVNGDHSKSVRFLHF